MDFKPTKELDPSPQFPILTPRCSIGEIKMNVLTANILATNSLLSTSQRHARVNSGEAGPVLSTPQRHARSCDSWIGVLF